MTAVATINIVISESPLLTMEACDKILNQAKQMGVESRTIVEVIDKYDWNALIADGASMSLFSEVKLTDIRFNKAPNKEAQNALVELAAAASEENLLLIRLPKIEKRQKSTKWFKAVSQGAKVEELWPPRPQEYLGWLKARAQSRSLNIDNDALRLLAEQTEGNLLAAAQTLDKLQLLYPDASISLEKVSELIADNARYSIFLCLDEALAGKGARAVKMLHKFEQEGIVPVVLLSNLYREVGLCHQVALANEQGLPPMQALAKSFLWDSKKRIIVNAASRLPLAIWQKLMVRCAYLDRLIKGQEKGNIWQEFELCLWMISGQKIWGQNR